MSIVRVTSGQGTAFSPFYWNFSNLGSLTFVAISQHICLLNPLFPGFSFHTHKNGLWLFSKITDDFFTAYVTSRI